MHVNKNRARETPRQDEADHSKRHAQGDAACTGSLSNQVSVGTTREQNNLRQAYSPLHDSKRQKEGVQNDESTLLLLGSVQSVKHNDLNLRERNRPASKSADSGNMGPISTHNPLFGKGTPAHRWVRTASTVRGNRLNATSRKNGAAPFSSKADYDVSRSIRDIIRQRSREERVAESKNRAVTRSTDTQLSPEKRQATVAPSQVVDGIGKNAKYSQKLLRDESNVCNMGVESNVAGLSDGTFPVAPQVRVVDGRIVVNEKSLIVSAMDERASILRDFIRVEESGNKLNSATYANYTKAEKWTREDTDFFYEALRQFGTDFSLLQRLFPGRSRRQLKKKYLVEDKVNPSRIEAAINDLKPRQQLYRSLIDLLTVSEQNASVEDARELLSD